MKYGLLLSHVAALLCALPGDANCDDKPGVQQAARLDTQIKVEMDYLLYLPQDYEKQAPVLSDDAKKKKQEEFQKALIDARKQANDLQEDMGRKEQEAMATILQKLTQVVAEIAEREQLTFVMEKSSLLYGPQAADITNEVVRRYNDRFGGVGGKAAAKTSQPQKPAQQPQQKPPPQQQQQPPPQQPPPPGNK